MEEAPLVVRSRFDGFEGGKGVEDEVAGKARDRGGTVGEERRRFGVGGRERTGFCSSSGEAAPVSPFETGKGRGAVVFGGEVVEAGVMLLCRELKGDFVSIGGLEGDEERETECCEAGGVGV